MGDCWFPKQEAAQEKDVQTPKNKKRRANSNEKKAVETEDNGSKRSQKNEANTVKKENGHLRQHYRQNNHLPKAGGQTDTVLLL